MISHLTRWQSKSPEEMESRFWRYFDAIFLQFLVYELLFFFFYTVLLVLFCSQWLVLMTV